MDRNWRWISHWRPNFPDLRRHSLHERRGSSAGRQSTRRGGRVSKNSSAAKVRIGPLKIGIRVDLWQRLRTHLDNHALRPFNLLFCVEKRRVALQRCQNCLLQGKGRHPGCRGGSPSNCSFATACSLGAGESGLTEYAQRCKNPERKKKSSHTTLAIRCRKNGAWIQRSLIALPPIKEKLFRLTIIVNFRVDVQPCFLLVRCEVVQHFHQVAHHLLTNAPHQGGAFRCDADHHFAAVITSGRAHHVAEILQARHQSAGRCCGVPHLLRDFRHGEHFLAVEVSEKEKLWERHVTRRELLAEAQHKTALHYQNDMGKPFGIRTNFIGRSSCKRSNRSRVQGDKIRNGQVTCQSFGQSLWTTAIPQCRDLL